MKQFVFILAALFATAAQAASFSIPFSCGGGGTRVMDGDWDATSGNISYTITLSNCMIEKDDGTILSGTITASGKFAELGGGKYDVDLQDTVDVSFVGADNGSSQCSRHIAMVYDGTNSSATNARLSMNNCTMNSSQSTGVDILSVIRMMPFSGQQ